MVDQSTINQLKSQIADLEEYAKAQSKFTYSLQKSINNNMEKIDELTKLAEVTNDVIQNNYKRIEQLSETVIELSKKII